MTTTTLLMLPHTNQEARDGLFRIRFQCYSGSKLAKAVTEL
jgi:hypothetical protein